ncbi:MAG TPA: hypothetical protein VGD69_11365 [Herpetosiphonaceae bacterium]
MLPTDAACLRHEPSPAQADNVVLGQNRQATEADVRAYLGHLATPCDDGSATLQPLTHTLTPLNTCTAPS